MNFTQSDISKIKFALPYGAMLEISNNTGIKYITVAVEFSRIKRKRNYTILDAAVQLLKQRGFDIDKVLD